MNLRDLLMGNKPTGLTVAIDEGLCTGCGACAQICPRGILYVDDQAGVCKVTDHSKCDGFRGCESVCPVGAIKVN